MYKAIPNSMRTGTQWLAMILLIATTISLAPLAAHGEKKKKGAAPAAAPAKAEIPLLEALDYSKIVWPNPPAVTRVKYLNYFANEKFHPEPEKEVKKASWMDRMAGGQTQAEKKDAKPLYSLWTPYGVAVDRAGKIYVADGRVGAIFIFNSENKEAELIKSGAQVRFGFIVGLAMDDDDRLFVSDSGLHRVMVFDAQHKFQGVFSEGLMNPGGMAIDTENRFLYVADADLDQVLVFDADTYKLLRRIGTGGKQHRLTTPGDFSKPTNVAVDSEGNLYVTDTWNDRVEIFDADGGFIRTFGKNGDGPGRFARPKGIAIDADGQIWVADGVQDRLQIFTPEGTLLMWMGGHGHLPGQFTDLTGLAIDKKNRVVTSEQYPGRVQLFQYFTNAEARAELAKRAEKEKTAATDRKDKRNAAGEKTAPATDAPATTPGSASTAAAKSSVEAKTESSTSKQ
jgi:DNA-binding beta-propeller fold protein YncE